MTIYKTTKAFNNPVSGEYTPMETEITKEMFDLLVDKGLENYVCQIGIVAKSMRSCQELVDDILESAKFLTKEVLDETIGKLVDFSEIFNENLEETHEKENKKPHQKTDKK